MDDKKHGLSFMEALLLIFVVLKLVGVIHWSWIWVLSPFWGSIIFALAFLIWLRVTDGWLFR